MEEEFKGCSFETSIYNYQHAHFKQSVHVYGFIFIVIFNKGEEDISQTNNLSEQYQIDRTIVNNGGLNSIISSSPLPPHATDNMRSIKTQVSCSVVLFAATEGE